MRELERILRTTAIDEKLRKDWSRQLRTAARIAEQHANGYGTVLLADEVGMGKTYVALAVMSRHIFQSTKNNRKVLLIVPPNSVLATKWAQEIRSFNGKYLNHNDGKQLRPMVVKGFWELVQNLHNYDDFAFERVSADMKECFAFALWQWWRTSRRRKRERVSEWDIYGDRHDNDLRYLNFCSRCSIKALQCFLDREYIKERAKFEQMLKALKDGDTDHVYLKELLRTFSHRQDLMEPNVFILGMGALRKARSDSSNSRLFTCYLAALSLKGCWSPTRKIVLKTLKSSNLLVTEEMRGNGKLLDWFMDLGTIDLWGMRAIAEEFLAQREWKCVLSALTAGKVDSLQALQEAVIQAKLAQSGIGLAVIDEVHNWKNGTNGAEQFRRQYTSRITWKLIMSATPFQLDQDELGSVFRYAGAAKDKSSTLITNLLTDDGAARKCLEESERFLAAWQSIGQADLGLLREHLDRYSETGSPVACLASLLGASGASDELRFFVESIKGYRTALDSLGEKLSEVVIRHLKPRDKRHFHAGAEFRPIGVPDYGKIRRTLYKVPGYGGAGDALLNFLAMRVDQMVRRDTKGREVNAHLLGGITSSNGAFRESNVALLKERRISPATKAYLDFFSRTLESTPHPKVTATVERAPSNYRAGMKTLIFCERLPTQKELIVELTRRIATEIFGGTGLADVRERQYLLGEYRGVELFWSRSYLCAMGMARNDRERLRSASAEIVADAAAVLETLPRLNERQVLKVLDLAIVRWLAQSLAGDRVLDFASLLLDSVPALEKYLGITRNANEAIDEEPEVGDSNGITADHLPIIFESANIWHAVPNHKTLHQTLWALLVSELAELARMGAGQMTVAATLVDLGQGLRKVLLRLDALTSVQRKEKESRTDAVVRMLLDKAATPTLSPWTRAEHFLQVLSAAEGSICRTGGTSQRQSLWRGVHLKERDVEVRGERLMTGGLVSCLNGDVDNPTRNSRCAAFNSPLLPDILVCTAIGSEGIDLHLYCDDVIHHDLPWNPAKLEQRTGRIDRVGSLAERNYDPAQPDCHRLNIGIPFLAHNYETYQYERLLVRARKFEVLLGQPEFVADLEEEIVDDAGREVVREVAPDEPQRDDLALKCLPDEIVQYLKLDLSVPELTDRCPQSLHIP